MGIDVMEDPVIKVLLQDLDVDMYNPSGMFDTFDPDGNKCITTSEMVQALMKLRGAPQKNDLIASWVAIRALRDKMDELTSNLRVTDKQQTTHYAPNGRGKRHARTQVG